MQQHYTAAVSRVQLLCSTQMRKLRIFFLCSLKVSPLTKVCRILINTSVYLEFCKLKAESYKQALRNFLWQLTARITVLRVFVKYFSRLVVVFYPNSWTNGYWMQFLPRRWCVGGNDAFFINAWETNSGNTCVSTAANRVVKFAWLFARATAFRRYFADFVRS